MKKLQTIKKWPRRRPRPETILSLLLIVSRMRKRQKKKTKSLPMSCRRQRFSPAAPAPTPLSRGCGIPRCRRERFPPLTPWLPRVEMERLRYKPSAPSSIGLWVLQSTAGRRQPATAILHRLRRRIPIQIPIWRGGARGGGVEPATAGVVARSGDGQ